MGLFSAIGKAIARYANDKHTERQRKKAPDTAYKKAGKKMSKARKKGTYINGSATYKQELRKENQRISKQHERTDDFINDL